MNNGPDHLFAHLVVPRNGGLLVASEESGTNYGNVCLGQFAGVVAASSKTPSGSPSTFTNAIANVVSLRAKKQVCGVAACRVVPTGAIVQDLKPRRNGAMRENPRETMSQKTTTDKVEPPVTKGVFPSASAFKDPALVFFDLRPESFRLVGGKRKGDGVNSRHDSLQRVVVSGGRDAHRECRPAKSFYHLAAGVARPGEGGIRCP